MSGNFEIALQLLGVGMLTVFMILFIVVFLGNLIIRFVNRFVPQTQTNIAVSKTVETGIHPGNMAAIVAAVNTVTNGKGKVVKVEKL